MKRLVLAIALVLTSAVFAAAGRSYGDTGTATTTNTTVTLNFGGVNFTPSSYFVCNDNASGGQDLIIDPSDGVATTDITDSTNIVIKGQECFKDNPPGTTTNDFKIGLITAASTAAYRIGATAR